jgi:hypothetical protein
MKKTYEVELRRTTFITVWVDAETEDVAEALAWEKLKAQEFMEDSSWDIESIEVINEGESKC